MDEAHTIYYKNLLDEALTHIKTPKAMVVGALATDTNAFEKNKLLFENAITNLESKGVHTFNQLPFLDIHYEHSPKNYALKFEIFYKGLIYSKMISTLYVLPEYENSKGTLAEIEYAKAANVPVVYL